MPETSPLRIVVHIGLHKTATRFFQNFVFAQLASTGVIFNPSSLMTPLHALYRDASAEDEGYWHRNDLSDSEDPR